MPKKIVSAGHICLDITPAFPAEQTMDFKQLFLPGKLLNVGKAHMSVGGSVNNTGMALSFFGADVTLMARVGADAFGDTICGLIENGKVRNRIVRSENSDTSYSIVIAPPGVDRIFLHNPGANDEFGPEDIDFDAVRDADLFHFGYPTIMRRMHQNPEELIEMFRRVRAANTLTSLDLAAVTEGTPAAQADWRSIFSELLPYVDYFVPSAEELCFLIDRERYYDWMRRAGGKDVTEILDWERDIRPLAEQAVAWGAKAVLVKCGTPGMYLRTADGAAELLPGDDSWNGAELFEESYQADRFCSATGAGDVSIAAFLSAALEGCTPKRCLQLAAGAGAYCVTTYDAVSGLVPLREIGKRIDSGWEKRKKQETE